MFSTLEINSLSHDLDSTVGMKFLKYFFLLPLALSVATLFMGCKSDEADGDDGNDIVVDVLEPGDTAARTVLVYMMAENNLSYFAGLDLAEMNRSAATVPDSCYMLAFVDALTNPYICRFYRNAKGFATCDTVYSFDEDFNSTDTIHFNRVLDWVASEYPSKNFGLVMWSHGSGWTRNLSYSRSIGADNGMNSASGFPYKSMEMEELAGSLGRLSAKMDYILFDACFMQSAEVAYELRNSAEWLIGSAAEIPANGAPYDRIITELFSFPFNPDALIQKYSKGYSSYLGVLLSAVKCSAIDGLADATAAFVPAYFSCDSVVDYSDVFSYLSGGCFWGNNLYPEYFDMNAVMLHRLPDDAYHAWRSALDEAVPYKVASSKWLSGIRECNYAVNDSVYSGLSMFVPRADTNYARLNADFKTTGWYNASGWSSAGW